MGVGERHVRISQSYFGVAPYRNWVERLAPAVYQSRIHDPHRHPWGARQAADGRLRCLGALLALMELRGEVRGVGRGLWISLHPKAKLKAARQRRTQRNHLRRRAVARRQRRIGRR